MGYVNWTSVVNATTGSNGSIYKTHQVMGWSAKAVTTDVIGPNGGELSFKFNNTGPGGYCGVGLCSNDTGYSLNDMDYCIYLNSRKVSIYELGTFRSYMTYYASTNDTFKIKVENDVIKYYYNTSLVRMIAPYPITYPLFGECTMVTPTVGLSTAQLVLSDMYNGVKELGNYSAMWNGRLILVQDNSGNIIINGTSAITNEVLGCDMFNDKIVFWGTNDNGTTQTDAYEVDGDGYTNFNKYR
jgi:hypothetical protein